MDKRKATVCIVHRDATLLQELGTMMESGGIAVDTYGASSEFLQRPPKPRPGCLILGMQLPDMDGLELQRRLRDQGDTAPVIFLADRGCEVSMAVEAMRQGAFDFLEAPIQAANLLRVVKAALRH